MNLEHLSDEELLAGLKAACAESHRGLAKILAHLGEVEARRLELEAASPSLYDYCIRRLGMSNGEAFRRIAAARIGRRFPSVAGAIERGEINLTSVVMLRDHFTAENVEELLREASGKTKREIEALIAKLAPKPDVPSLIRTLPTPTASLPIVSAAEPERVTARVKQRIAPLSETRHEVRFTASTDLRDKIERIADLMRHRNPTGDLAVIFDRASDLLLAELEKERLGKTKQPRKAGTKCKRGYITRAVRREVYARDGMQCTFVDAAGNRCPCTTFLELDHIVPRAQGGSDDAANLRVRCRAHNRLHAEKTYGRKRVEERIHFRQRKSHCVKKNDAAKPSTQAAPPTNDVFDLANRGLVTMGYREKEARRAIDIVKDRHIEDTEAITPATVIREALAVLS